MAVNSRSQILMHTLNVAGLNAAVSSCRSSGLATVKGNRGLRYLRTAALWVAIILLGGCGGGGDDDDGQAQLRMLNVSPNYSSLDLYINDDDDNSDMVKFSAVDYETVSSYTTVAADTYSIKFRRNGSTATLLTLTNDSLGKDSHATYVAYGSSGRFGALKVGEDKDEDDLDTNESAVQVANTSEAGALDVYFTDATADLNDATAQIAGVASGAVSGLANIDSGTYRLRVTGSGDKTDLRLDVSDVVFESKKTSTVVLTLTSGGVLVNAIVLPQQGGVSKKPNLKARLRGAVGISGSGTVTATAGNTTLLTNAAVGVIGSKYSQVTAGDVGINLRIGGNSVTVPTQTLTAGSDYTLLFWTDVNGTRTSLISDDNRLSSTSGRAKIRLMNGMSALNVPATLAIDFAPIAESVELGQASSFVETYSGTDFQFDVTNSSTSASLLTRDSVDLDDAGIYTLFMWGGSPSASGTLRKDR